ncbi:MAG: M20 family metallopeptidase [Ktedonobacterales bacterium]
MLPLPADLPPPGTLSASAAALTSAAQRDLAPRLPEFLRDLEALVNLDSGTYDRADVERVGAVVRGRCAAWGAQIEVNPGGDYADSFAATLHGQGNAHIMLLCHLDTVFPTGTAAARPFRIEGDHALGPGACDMKGGVLAAIYAIEALRRLGFDDFAQVRLLCTTDEEVGAPSSRQFVERMAAGAHAVLVLEAARENGDIVGQRKGGGFYRLTVTGRAAHAGVEPQKGRSAALTLSRQVVALHALNDYVAGRTVNVGTLRAGSRPNVVPDAAEADVDLRTYTQADMAALLRDIERALARVTLEGTHFTWKPLQVRPPWERNPGTEGLVARARAVAATLGFDVHAATTGGTSDGNFTAALGIPTLDGLGPIGGLDHGPLEYVAISSVVPRVALLAGLIAALAEG